MGLSVKKTAGAAGCATYRDHPMQGFLIRARDPDQRTGCSTVTPSGALDGYGCAN